VRLAFTKMNGAGNDFVMLDNRSRALSLSREQIARLCDRHRGVGADGLLLAEPPSSGSAQLRMRYYNSDGGEAEMCGNGARCFARFAQRLGACADRVAFETQAGLVRATLEGERVRVALSDPRDLRLGETLALSRGEVEVHSVNTGVPHAVALVDDLEKVDVAGLGREIRRHARFAPAGTNANFAQRVGDRAIRVRTYERGVEAETLACGTGVTACALVAHLRLGMASPVAVRVQGGDTLEVSFRRAGEGFADVCLSGPADFVFDGTVEA
jgi:diaminopimelate epimerase